MEASMADWSQLPRELVVLIASRIEHLSDYIRFCAVCKWWLSITAQENPRPRLRESPWLMLPAKNNNYSHQLYSPLMEDRFHPIKQEEKEETCLLALGSSPDGWVCMVDQKGNIYLFNPFSGSRFALPPFLVKKYSNNVSNQGLRGLPCEHLIKVAWTPDPTNSGPKSVVISTTKRLAVWRHSKQEQYWTTFWSEYAPFSDIVYHEEEDMFFMMSHFGCLMTFDLYSLIKVACHLPRPPRDISKMLIVSKELRYYLAIRGGPSSSSSSLVLVVREIEKRKTKGFKVFELNRRRMRWEPKESLEDDGMLFLGLNSSTYHFMTGGGGSKCKGNRIYFTDDSIGRSSYDDNLNNLGRHDMGVFSLDDGSFEWNHCRKWKGPHPIWIFPNWRLPSIDFEM
ncbi:putative F-box protein [Acorus gramineus]|uniref:F-box protein n=1 Tax=Acorus gramineus TaxID=55184 RepID=A0AAV9BI67_ACOGR|nr:putative F-box protein [Acorus gramineus]